MTGHWPQIFFVFRKLWRCMWIIFIKNGRWLNSMTFNSTSKTDPRRGCHQSWTELWLTWWEVWLCCLAQSTALGKPWMDRPLAFIMPRHYTGYKKQFKKNWMIARLFYQWRASEILPWRDILWLQLFTSLLLSFSCLRVFHDLIHSMSSFIPCLRPFHFFIHSTSLYIPCLHLFHVFIHSMSSYIPCLRPFHLFIHSTSLSIPCLHPFHVFFHSMSSPIPYLHPFYVFIHSISSSIPRLHPLHIFIHSTSSSTPYLHPFHVFVIPRLLPFHVLIHSTSSSTPYHHPSIVIIHPTSLSVPLSSSFVPCTYISIHLFSAPHVFFARLLRFLP